VAPSANRIQSIAVLPLDNLSRDPEQEYFADGMTDALIGDLAQISGLRVISRTSVMQFKAAARPLPEIARTLHVDAVVEGSVLRSGGRVRITAQLIDAVADRHLWADKYERDLGDVLTLQSEVAQTIARQVQAHVSPQEAARLSTARRVNPQAHELYLLGRYHTNKRNGDSLNRAIDYFNKAIEIDPGFAPAYAGLSDAYSQRDIWAGLGIGAHAKDMRAAALKAIELDNDLAEAHLSLAAVRFQYDWDWVGSEAEFKRAIALNGGLAQAHGEYSYFLQAMRRHDEAIASAKRAADLDPLSPTYICDEGRILYRARRYDAAIARYLRALELDPDFRPALSRLAEVYTQTGRYDQALATLEKLRRIRGAGEPLSRPLGRLYAAMGRTSDALEMVRQIEKEGTTGGEAFALAVVYTGLGDYDRAIAALERGAAARSLLPFTFVDPMLDPLQSKPRFKQLLKKLNLPS
jgi:TolB-like protein/Tfp pilus assembly protein PilF